LKLKVATAPDAAIAAARPSPVSNAQNADINSVSSDIKALHEQQDALQAEIEQHEQTKVETTSKYPVRITGLVLFNAFSNAGVVDDADLPTIALPRIPDSSHGSVGATMRQTIVGVEATGPHLWGARSSAQISADFFGGATANSYGYSAPSGFLRLREAGVQLDWDRTTAQGGISEPLITPLSPTSYATIAMPALSASGNLWAWSPQLRVEQRIPFSDHQRLALEAGLIDPSSQDNTSDQLDTPVEASRRPGYEGRVSTPPTPSWCSRSAAGTPSGGSRSTSFAPSIWQSRWGQPCSASSVATAAIRRNERRRAWSCHLSSQAG